MDNDNTILKDKSKKSGSFSSNTTGGILDTPKIEGTFNVSDDNQVWIPDSAKLEYHTQRLSHSKWAFRLSFFGSILGFIIIVFCIGVSMYVGHVEWSGVISGIIVESVAVMFFHLSNKADDKITDFFKEVTVDAKIEKAISLSKNVKNDSIRDELFVKLSLFLCGINEDRICKNTKEVCKENIHDE